MPKVSVIVRKAYGAGLYAMSGPAFEPEATHRPAHGEDRGDGAGGRGQRGVRQQDRRDRRRRRAGARSWPSSGPIYEEDVDLLRLASELVVDAVVDSGGPARRDRRPAGLRPGQGPPFHRPPPRRPAGLSVVPSRVDRREVGPRDGLQAEAPVDRRRTGGADRGAGRRGRHATSRRSRSCRRRRCRRWPAPARSSPRCRGGRACVYAALVPNLKGARAGADRGRRRADRHRVRVGDLQPAQRAHDGRRVDRGGRRRSARSRPGARRRGRVLRLRLALRGRHRARRRSAALGAAARRRGRRRLTYADTTGMATPRRIDDAARRHRHRRRACTCTTTAGTALVNAYRALQLRRHPLRHRRSAGSAARPSPRGRPATSPPRTSCTCSTTSASTPASTLDGCSR